MDKLQTLSQSLDQYTVMQPDNIEVYVYRQNGGSLSVNGGLFYRFIFSEEGIPRKDKMFKSHFDNTKALYKLIKKEFLNGNIITSAIYDKDPYDWGHSGIRLENNRKQKLNIFFANDLLDEKRDELFKFRIMKKHDFALNAKKRIDHNQVERITIRPANYDGSSMIYIPNNEDYSSLQKRNHLAYYYHVTEHGIEGDDLTNISDIIRYYINQNLKDSPNYRYHHDHRGITTGLDIYFTSLGYRGRKYIDMIDPNLIDYLEKDSLIDDLYQVREGMKQGKQLKMEGIQNPVFRKKKEER